MSEGARTVLQAWRRGSARLGEHWSTLFPAARWRALLPEGVRLEVEADGEVTVVGRSHGRSVALGVLRGSGSLDLALEEDWLWIETRGRLEAVTWSAATGVELPRITAVVPSIGRVAETRAQILNFCASELVDLILVIDQRGGIGEDEGVAALGAAHPGRVRVIEQGNFGGSGGYARGMIESLADPARALLLSDDDAYLDPESLRRMATHQALARAHGIEEIVGSPVLDAEDPTSLQICAEYVRASDFFWTKADSLDEPRSTEEDPDGLADALDLVHEPNYAGWWGCLLPPGAVARLGAPLPLFLKWDDAEYGLRAVDAGYSITVLPGTGVSHPRWDTTSTLWSWSGALSQRNRLAVAAARGASRGVLVSSLAHQAKHVLSLQYDVAESWNAAGAALADDPSWFGSDLLTARDWASGVWGRAQEATLRAAAALDPQTPTALARDWRARRNSGALRALALLARPGRVHVDDVREVRARSYAWWDSLGARALRLVDSSAPALVVDPPRARRLLAEALATHARLALRWGGLRTEYASRARTGARFETWSAELGIPIPSGDPDLRAGAAPHGKARS